MTVATVPSPLVVAYASWGQCDDLVDAAAAHGANVIIWFSILFEVVEGAPRITGSLPKVSRIAERARAIRDAGHSVVHLVSMGGWNAPLPDTSFSGREWFDVFHAWNVANAEPDIGWDGFDGIDWDPEGNDNPTSARNQMTAELLALVGSFSQMAKRASYIVAMAPAQSYLDVGDTQFDLDIYHTPWWKADFPYHGRNTYAYWLAFYGDTSLDDGSVVRTFDWVALQIYEGWSRANQVVGKGSQPFEKYVGNLVDAMHEGWTIDFGSHGGKKTVSVPRDRLVIGVSNGWAQPFPPQSKFLFVNPEDLDRAWHATKFAGFMFWTIAEEGAQLNGKQLFLAKELGQIVSASALACPMPEKAIV